MGVPGRLSEGDRRNPTGRPANVNLGDYRVQPSPRVGPEQRGTRGHRLTTWALWPGLGC